MPYIVVKSNQQEVDRRELTAMLVFGRAPECDVAIRDIALSRRHCRIEACDDGWIALDLGSKNGTSINGERLGAEPRLLTDGDVLRLGRSKIVFHAGLPNEDIAERLMAPGRPADPHEALAGTVSGFQMLEHGETEVDEHQPLPQPKPREPLTLQGAELQELLTAIASSSWDSIYAEARQPTNRRPMPRDDSDDAPRRRVSRPRSPIDLSLQAGDGASDPVLADPHNDVLAITEAVASATEVMLAPEPARAASDWRQRFKKWMPKSRKQIQKPLPYVAACLWVIAGALGINYWTSLTSGSTHARTETPAPAKVETRTAEAVSAAQVIVKDTPVVPAVTATAKAIVKPEQPKLLDLEPMDQLNLPNLFEPQKPSFWPPIQFDQNSLKVTAESLLETAPLW